MSSTTNASTTNASITTSSITTSSITTSSITTSSTNSVLSSLDAAEASVIKLLAIASSTCTELSALTPTSVTTIKSNNKEYHATLTQLKETLPPLSHYIKNYGNRFPRSDGATTDTITAGRGQYSRDAEIRLATEKIELLETMPDVVVAGRKEEEGVKVTATNGKRKR